MPRKVKHENFRVVVTPDIPKRYYRDDAIADIREVCKDVARSIRRHVDNIEDVNVECDTVEVCSYCGYKWSGETDSYNGGCCNEDLAHEPR